jgi:hypothetical protein
MNGYCSGDDTDALLALKRDTVKQRDVIDAFWDALNAPGRFRCRLIKWLFPEIKIAADKALQEHYWKDCGR